MELKELKIGIISPKDYKKRTVAIARGQYTPKPGEPKIFFESLQSMACVLSNDNQELLRIILNQNPDSLKELEATTGRETSNLFQSLELMARYGIVELEKHETAIKPIVKATEFKIEFSIK